MHYPERAQWARFWPPEVRRPEIGPRNIGINLNE
jgi:hypothetical protein